MPNEVWLNIFELLEYKELKNCTMVCRNFNILANHPSLDDNLFRGRVLADNATIPIRTLSIHPILNHMWYECRGEFEDIVVWNFKDGHSDEIPVHTLSAAKELATSPGVKFLKMQVYGMATFHVQNKNGVNVLQVLKALCRFFNRPARSGLTLHDLPWIKPTNMPNRLLTIGDDMGDRTGWTGFDEKTLDGKGRLCLHVVHL